MAGTKVLTVYFDRTSHTLALYSSTGRYAYRVDHPGCEPVCGNLTRAQAAKLVDEWDEDCNEGRAILGACDDEALVNFRNGR